MAIYIIVDKDKDPLGPGEINAGGTIEVNDGDIFVFSSGASNTTKFEAASGTSTDFEIRFNDSNPNNFSLDIKGDLNATITIANGVDMSDVDIDAKDADSVTLTAGDNVSIGKYDGSEDGTDTLTIGDKFKTTEDIKTYGGNDVITIADGASIHNIDTGEGADSVTMGDDLDAHDIKTGKGDDSLTIGDGADVNKINTEDGDDHVSIGSGASIDKLDGGKGNDTLATKTDLPDADNFETVICFASGTMIRSERGDVSIESLATGDLVATLDHGYRPIRWIGSSVVPGKRALAPVHIKRGALGNDRDMWVSQQHRMLIGDWRTEMLFGKAQTLVAAKHLVDHENIKIVEMELVEYFHILFDNHEIIIAEGVASESFHPGHVGLASLCEPARDEIFQIFPELRVDPSNYGPSTRSSLRAHEGILLAS